MNAFLISLQEHDDRVSLRDRMSWARARRILLIWPRRLYLPLGAADLRFLQYHARRLGAELGIVTRRGDVRALAAQVGVPTFSNTVQAQRRPWPAKRSARLPRRQRPPRPLPRRAAALPFSLRSALFLFAVLAVLTLLGVFIPRARVTLVPQVHNQQEELTFLASAELTGPSARGELPLLPLEVTVEGDGKVQATQAVTVPLSKAQGLVRFTNLTALPQSIPAGTVVYVPGEKPIRFVTLNASGLPGSPGQFVEIPVEAVEAGMAGNVIAGAIQAIEGPLAFSLAVTNPQPLSGGMEAERLTVTTEEVERLRRQLEAQLQEQALTQARQRLATGDVLLASPFQRETLEERLQPPLETHPANLRLSLRLRFRFYFLPAAALQEVITARLNALLPADFIPMEATLGYRLRPESMEVLSATPLRVRFELEARRNVSPQLRLEEVRLALRGRRVSDARLLLRALPLAEPPRIELWPSFWPWLPLLPLQISVES